MADPRRYALINYIVSEDRMYPEDWGFANYDEFVNHQYNVINNLDEGMLSMLENLQKIVPISMVMDKEHMIEFPMMWFAFDKNNKLVFYNEK